MVIDFWWQTTPKCSGWNHISLVCLFPVLQSGLGSAELFLSSRWCWCVCVWSAGCPKTLGWLGFSLQVPGPLLHAVAPSGPASRVADRLHGSSELPRVSSSNGQASLGLKPRTSPALYWLKHHRPSPDSGRGSGTRAWSGGVIHGGPPRVIGLSEPVSQENSSR